MCLKITFHQSKFFNTALCSRAAATLKNILFILLIIHNYNNTKIRNDNFISDRIRIIPRKQMYLRTAVVTGTSALALEMPYSATENTH